MRRPVQRARAAVGVLLLCLGMPRTSWAQPPPSAVTPEVFGNVSFGHLANCCRVFGDGPLVGGGLGIHWRRLGVEFEANRMLGLAPKSLPCAIQYGQTCLPGRQGAESATLASVNALVMLARTRFEPFVSGGIGLLWSTHSEPELDLQFSGVPNTPPIAVTPVQRDAHDRGFTVNVGGGVRVPVTSAVAFRSEVRLYDATLLSAYNMALVRLSVGASYHW